MRNYSILIVLIVSIVACGPFGRSDSKNLLEPDNRNPQQFDSHGNKSPSTPNSLPDKKTGSSVSKGIPTTEAQRAEICADIVRERQKVPDSSTSQFLKPEDFQAEFLTIHNDMRSRYGLSHFSWDNDIADYAQAWANYLRDNYNCAMHHRSQLGRRDGKKYGENLGLSVTNRQLGADEYLGSPTLFVLAWTDECKDYSYENRTCKAGEQCGHFTQVVWKDSQKVGCGVATCRDGAGQKNIWVCNYDPAGNILDSSAPSGSNITFRPF